MATRTLEEFTDALKIRYDAASSPVKPKLTPLLIEHLFKLTEGIEYLDAISESNLELGNTAKVFDMPCAQRKVVYDILIRGQASAPVVHQLVPAGDRVALKRGKWLKISDSESLSQSLRPSDSELYKLVRNTVENPSQHQPFFVPQFWNEFISAHQDSLSNIWRFDPEQYKAMQKDAKQKGEGTSLENNFYHPFFMDAINKSFEVMEAFSRSKGIQWNSSVSLYHSYSTALFPSSGHMPDFTLLNALDGNGNSKPHVSSIVAFIEIKTEETFSPTSYVQGFDYAQRLLLAQPLRTIAFTALCNNKCIQWLQVARVDESKFAYTAHEAISMMSTTGINLIVAALSSTLDQLHYPAPIRFSTSGYTWGAEYYLGKGAFAKVFSCSPIISQPQPTPPLVLKCYQDRAAAKIESDVLSNQLVGVNGVPYFLDTMFASGYYCNIVGPLAEPLELSTLSYVDFTELVDLLKSAHDRNVLCRDVRPANIMRSNNRPYLIDWNSALILVDGHCEALPGGTLRYASDGILNAFISQTPYNHSAVDDLVSLARVLFVKVFGSVFIFPGELDDASAPNILACWIRFRSCLSPALYDSLMIPATTLDYEGLKKSANTFVFFPK